ncbi:MAG: B12-binding domain-containing radical SAM protein [Phycisphaerae bacterium]
MTYRHALCLYPYVVDQRPGIGIFPPTGLEYIATALKGHVRRISLVDLRHERPLQPIRKMTRFIEREGVDLICICVGWRARYRQICEYLGQLPSRITTVVGGQEASNEVEDILRRCPNVDAVVRGEGEETIVELTDDRPWNEILGLSFKRNGSIVHNDNRPLPPIDSITPPDRSLRRSRYDPTLRGTRLLPLEFDTILASRGCPYKCDFCSLVINPLGQLRGYVSRSPQSVVDEIESSPARIILFADDIFFLEPRKAERLCDLLIERGIDKRYVVQCRIEVYKFPRMLEKAYRAGFRVFLFGIESASDRILKDIHKGFTTDDLRKAFEVLRRLPFWYHGYFIYGIIGQTEAEMLAIPSFARELGLHSISLSLLRMDKFTPMREKVERMPGYRISSNGYVYSEQFGKKELRRIRNRIRNDFQYRPAQLARTLRALNACDIISYRQMVRLSLLSPLVAWDTLQHRGRKVLRRRRARA